MTKTLFTSYKCDINDEIIQSILKKWQHLNPNYTIKYFSDKDIDLFFSETKYYNTFKLMRNGVARADFFRICYINKYGGYWFDLDLEPTKLDIPQYGNVHLFDLGYNNISYMFIGGSPNQKLFSDVISQVNKNILDNVLQKKAHVMDITGPRIIQNIICSKLNIKNVDGCLVGKNAPQIYLKNTEYEFIYKRQYIGKHKTVDYNKLQMKYKQVAYQMYNYI